MAAVFTKVFFVVVLLTFSLRVWLALRHSRHIAARRAAVPAEFAADITLESHQRAADYTRAKLRLGLVSGAVDLALLLALTLGGGLNGLWTLASPLANHPVLQGTAFIALVLALSGLISLPLSLYATFRLEARFGFNKMTWGLFVRDGIKSLMIGAIIGLPLIALALWLMTVTGRHWWLWLWLVWTGFSLLMVVVYPTVIAPLFNRFSPLADQALKARIEALLARTGFRSQGVFVMDGSKRSSHGNAYFTGFGSAKRIVFFDTLVEHLTPAEIEAVLAHELGHFKLRHVLKRIVTTFLLSLAALWLLGRLIDAAWFYQGLGLASQGPAQALLLFFLALPAFTFPLTPLMSRLSRRHEFEADDFAARETDARDLISALVKLYRDNAATLTPDPLYSAFYDSHPPAVLRIAHLKGEPS
ncbi:MAG: M48 family metallopeptidase [Paludibacterium sp.]|uniref:M48 family metallopeptidase n=1 Tax=Paludibacterium sp. TaxID=1917523 RepID=UPI0025E0A8C2|nr:M48 family metallopeptidase [Paludibacterium sp.]MBV8048279.1 M48 family metallopeptidase [Paludibacterium sp.]MBV8646474.1 M48 family metallopeptidase [Paludibacterium sp.]